MKVAITGGSGFVGRNAAQLLEKNGHEPIPLSRRTGVGLDDVAGLQAAFQGCEAVLHCAGINREIGDQTFAAVHVDGTRNVITAAQQAGVRKIVFMSFLRARPACGSGYHESKWAAEELIRRSGLDYTVIKAGVVYGRGDHMLDHLSHAFYTFPLFGLVGLKDRLIRPTAVEDMARVLVASIHDLRLSNKTVAVTGPEELTLRIAVKRVAIVVGKVPWFFRMPVWMHYAFASVCEGIMKVPLVAVAQIRILSEGLVESSPPAEPLPEDIAPTIPFSSQQIRRGLPSAGGFSLRDLRCCRSTS